MFELKNSHFTTIGPIYGFAQLALSYCSKMLGKKANLFLADQKSGRLYFITESAHKDYDANVFLVRGENRLKDVQLCCLQYINKKNSENKKILLQEIPFGGDSPHFLFFFREQLIRSIDASLLTEEKCPKRMWVVIGSGLLFKVLASIFIHTKFLLVRVGKQISPQIREDYKDRATFYESPLYFSQQATDLPPYPSSSHYDAKLWHFVNLYGEEGDYVWNVAKDPQNEKAVVKCEYFLKGSCKFGRNCKFGH